MGRLTVIGTVRQEYIPIRPSNWSNRSASMVEAATSFSVSAWAHGGTGSCDRAPVGADPTARDSKPSICRSARLNTRRSVKQVSIAGTAQTYLVVRPIIDPILCRFEFVAAGVIDLVRHEDGSDSIERQHLLANLTAACHRSNTI